MAQVTKLAQVLQGLVQNIDLTVSDLATNSVYVGGASGTQLTQTILNNLINLQNGTNFTTDTNSHTHDGRYYTETQLNSTTGGSAGSTLIGDDDSYSNFTPTAATVKGALSGIDAALASAGVAYDGTFKIENSSDHTKIMDFDASGITTGNTRTLKMADANVDLANLTNSNISPSAAIAYSKLAALGGSTNDVLIQNSSGYVTSSSILSTNLFLADGSVAATGNFNLNSNKITNLANGTAGSDGATYGQLLAVAAGLSWKNAVIVATTTTLPAYTWASGAGGADTLTANSTGTLTIDGVLTALGNRILVKNETGANAPYNGTYTVTTAGAVGVAYVLTRATDMQAWANIPGSVVVAESGTANADKAFICTSAPGGTLDTTNITFGPFGTYLADGTTLTLTGNTFSVANGGITETQINSSAFSSTGAITGGSGTKISVSVDNSTIDINGSDQLEVKAAGVGTTQLANASVTAAKLGSVTDGVTLDQSGAGSTLEIKTAGVGTTQLASASVTAAKLGSVTDGVTLDQSGAGSTLEIKSGGVGTTQLASQAVTSAKIATSALDQLTLTGGNGATLAVAYAPSMQLPMTSGVTLSANTSYLVRMALTGETAGRVYLADASSAAANGKFWAIGIASGGGSGVSAGGAVTVTLFGTWTLGSSDTAFGSTSVGLPVYLTTSGGFSITPQTTSGYASYKIGVVQTTTSILIDSKQFIGIS